jgi:DNA-binding MarR family transcriptional regulator
MLVKPVCLCSVLLEAINVRRRPRKQPEPIPIMSRPRSSQPPTENADFEVSNRLLFRVFQTTNLMHTQGTRFAADIGITTQQWSVLGALSRPQGKKGMTVGELSEFLLISRQNLTGLLNRLEAQGLTSRVADAADRRARRVVMTSAGRAVWPKLTQRIADFYTEALAGFSFDDRVSFLHYVDMLKKNLTRL